MSNSRSYLIEIVHYSRAIPKLFIKSKTIRFFRCRPSSLFLVIPGVLIRGSFSKQIVYSRVLSFRLKIECNIVYTRTTVELAIANLLVHFPKYAPLSHQRLYECWSSSAQLLLKYPHSICPSSFPIKKWFNEAESQLRSGQFTSLKWLTTRFFNCSWRGVIVCRLAWHVTRSFWNYTPTKSSSVSRKKKSVSDSCALLTVTAHSLSSWGGGGCIGFSIILFGCSEPHIGQFSLLT